ncbi:Crp/Fnr family transcriptional regulator [Reichenbachiella ulvae]|uniref:Crp/Fnr family transcriptional regulator n=1 Tax=Reichenbachiella ulvae TaxID=2980104 RepID=A0ABT3CNY5_9BACT|nr:Crp/Fnr family transcriptional regulator [Reichenbachiella ulvae]MCV9385334.1 Crp/Fnr family transcriptional regulator [Reichenbachiella ulvae]
MEAIRKILREVLDITPDEWDYFSSHLKQQQLSAKQFLVKTGQIARQIVFIDQGLLRSYHYLNGKEVNTYFACDGQFISAYASFISQTASAENVEAMEDCQLYSLSHQALQDCYDRFPRFEKLGRYLAEQTYLCVIERTHLMQTRTGREKYEHFIASYPSKIVQSLPQHMIASFLGMAPESLSRIRRELSIS